jgi:hypothetical protein
VWKKSQKDKKDTAAKRKAEAATATAASKPTAADESKEDDEGDEAKVNNLPYTETVFKPSNRGRRCGTWRSLNF